jgi:sacsin
MYKKELNSVGVRFEFQEASAYIGSRLIIYGFKQRFHRKVCILAASVHSVPTREGSISISPSELISSVKGGNWMKSTLGYRRPSDCIIYDSDWPEVSCISNQPFLDIQFYGEAILAYKPELELLGVIAGFKDNHQLFVDNFKFYSAAITSEATVLILKCICYVGSCDDFFRSKILCS